MLGKCYKAKATVAKDDFVVSGPTLLQESKNPDVSEKKVSVDGTLYRQDTDYAHGVRTAKDGTLTAKRALEKLKEGNARFVAGQGATRTFCGGAREALATHGQNPMAAVIGCADSRCPTELLFDVHAGDIFVLRNAGNTLTHAEGSMVGSAEYCCGHLGTNLLLVLGHTRCGAIAGATNMMLAAQGKDGRKPTKTTLERLLNDLHPVALMAKAELPEGSTAEEIAKHAVKVNVFYTIEKLLTYSAPLRNKVIDGELEVHGAIFDIHSGRVEFLGESPRLPLILGSKAGLLSPSARENTA